MEHTDKNINKINDLYKLTDKEKDKLIEKQRKRVVLLRSKINGYGRK